MWLGFIVLLVCAAKGSIMRNHNPDEWLTAVAETIANKGLISQLEAWNKLGGKTMTETAEILFWHSSFQNQINPDIFLSIVLLFGETFTGPAGIKNPNEGTPRELVARMERFCALAFEPAYLKRAADLLNKLTEARINSDTEVEDPSSQGEISEATVYHYTPLANYDRVCSLEGVGGPIMRQALIQVIAASKAQRFAETIRVVQASPRKDMTLFSLFNYTPKQLATGAAFSSVQLTELFDDLFENSSKVFSYDSLKEYYHLVWPSRGDMDFGPKCLAIGRALALSILYFAPVGRGLDPDLESYLLGRKVSADTPEEEAYRLIQSGFMSTFPHELLKTITEGDLTDLWYGTRHHVTTQNILDNTKKDISLPWLQEFLDLGEQQRDKFIQFATGRKRLPVGKFNAISPTIEIKAVVFANSRRMPNAHVRHHRVSIPCCSRKEELFEKLSLAMSL